MGREFYISEDQEDRRLDRLLRTSLPQIPLGEIMKAIRQGRVRLDAKKAKPETRVKAGQFLQLPWDEGLAFDKIIQATITEKPKFAPLPTIYRDENIWIINKPAGLLTQPDTKGADSVFTRVLAELDWQRTDFHPSTVQRLDRNTSGIILVALSGKFQRLLTELIRERKISKIYRAIVSGELPLDGKIDLLLLKDPSTNIVKVDKNGQTACTLYKRIATEGGLSLAEIKLITGRSHQIRVHFAAIGHPVLGDKKYGTCDTKAKRTLLHAYKIIFPKDERLGKLSEKTFTAEVPKDMKLEF